MNRRRQQEPDPDQSSMRWTAKISIFLDRLLYGSPKQQKNESHNLGDQYHQSIPHVSVPAIEFMWYGRVLYVQMNLKSFISTPDQKIKLHTGFLFKVDTGSLEIKQLESLSTWRKVDLRSLQDIKIMKNRKPNISLAANFPCLFHPHFTENRSSSHFLINKNCRWIDYLKVEEFEQDIGSYLLRVAKSLVYEEGYINVDSRKVANPRALKAYQEKLASEPYKFPTDSQFLPKKARFDPIPNQQLENPPRKVKFEVKDEKPAYSPESREKAYLQASSVFRSDFRMEHGASTKHEFYLTTNAFQIIKDHIGWGECNQDNTVEQGGILLGHAYSDPDTKVVYAIAERAVPGRLARGTAGYLEVTHETWKEMLDDVDNLHTDLQLIGWYHTHPNSLDVFMSGTDRATQRRLFENEWQFAIVLNPQKKIWRAFFGRESRECPGHVLRSQSSP